MFEAIKLRIRKWRADRAEGREYMRNLNAALHAPERELHDQ